MIKKYFIMTRDGIREYGILILIVAFIYVAIILTRLNNNLETTNKSIYNLTRNSPSQNQNETISVSEMMNQVNFRHEFDYIQNKLDDLEGKIDEINGTLGIVEINTR